ncbi:uncharacterized protein LOC135099708 isoform X2 [Scylla paramamosain]|uniref:uncharacterized protein LOC135099708 isoform X2 n=1 Tax=Scylla paramamosain TaxID=85552 RepID=UPI0030836CBA
MSQDGCSYWPPEAVYTLLELVKHRDVLWQITHPDYYKKNIKRGLFNKISQVLNKFQYLRGHFQKQLRRVEKHMNSTGRKPRIRWEFFDACSFLTPIYTSKAVKYEPPPSPSSFYSSTSSETMPSSDTHNNPLETPRKRKKEDSNEVMRMKCMDSMDIVESWQQEPKLPNRYDLVVESVKGCLSYIPDSKEHVKEWFAIKVQELVLEAMKKCSSK